MATHGAERLQSEPPSVRTGWLSRPYSFSSTKLLPGQFLVRGQRISKTYRRIQACRRRWTWHPRTPPSWRGRSHWSWSWTRPGGWSTASSLAGDTEKKRKWSVEGFTITFMKRDEKKKKSWSHSHQTVSQTNTWAAGLWTDCSLSSFTNSPERELLTHNALPVSSRICLLHGVWMVCAVCMCVC